MPAGPQTTIDRGLAISFFDSSRFGPPRPEPTELPGVKASYSPIALEDSGEVESPDGVP